MTSFCPHRVPRTLQGHAHVLRRTIVLLLGSLQLGVGTLGQNPQAPKETIADGYAIHQSIDLGGRIVDTSGSGAMYDTLVNLQSGPRILSQTLDLHAVANSTHRFFDTLSMSNSGYGGDPNNVTTLRVSKDKL